MFPIFSSSYFLFMIPALILSLLAQWWVNRQYGKWSKHANTRGLSGAEAAHRLLSYAQLQDIALEKAPGRLSDHYDPRSRTLRLSPGVAENASVAALAIAAHEIGHAVQDQVQYWPMKLRGALVPAVNIGSNLGMILIIAGLLLQGMLGTQLATQIAWLGVIGFSASAVFALATLPVEFDASSRAQQLLRQAGLVTSENEQAGIRSVLTAAALTYVAGLATAILQVLYYVMLVSGMGGRRRG